MWFSNQKYELWVDDKLFNLDYDFIIKKVRTETDERPYEPTHELSLYNINSFNIENVKIKNNDVILFEGVIKNNYGDSVSVYKSHLSIYTKFLVTEKIETQNLQKIKEFEAKSFFLKNDDIGNFFNISGVANIILNCDVFFNEADNLEYKIGSLIKNSNQNKKKYYYEKSQNKLIFNTISNNFEILTIINSSKLSTKSNISGAIKFINEVSLKCKPNFFLKPNDTIFFEFENYFIKDVTISGGSKTGYIMDVYATNSNTDSQVKDSGEDD